MKNRAERAVLAAVFVALLVSAGCGSGSKKTTSVSNGSSTSSSTTSTTIPSAAQPDAAVWPFADSATRYHEPRPAAEGFVIDYLGFVDPVIGSFIARDSRSGEVTIQPNSSGPVTTVTIRQLPPDNSWWVVAATTPNLRLEVPAANTSITSPVKLSGRSTAFEGTVNVEVRQDGTVTPSGADFVTGGANGEMGPFSKAISFSPPMAASGAIVLHTLGGESGTIREASVVRVRFG